MECSWVIPSYTYSTRKPPKVENTPIISGKYLVVIDGEAEYQNGWCMYSSSSYITIMDITIDENEEIWNRVIGKGIHNEEWNQVVAWMGPIPEFPRRSGNA